MEGRAGSRGNARAQALCSRGCVALALGGHRLTKLRPFSIGISSCAASAAPPPPSDQAAAPVSASASESFWFEIFFALFSVAWEEIERRNLQINHTKSFQCCPRCKAHAAMLQLPATTATDNRNRHSQKQQQQKFRAANFWTPARTNHSHCYTITNRMQSEAGRESGREREVERGEREMAATEIARASWRQLPWLSGADKLESSCKSIAS